MLANHPGWIWSLRLQCYSVWQWMHFHFHLFTYSQSEMHGSYCVKGVYLGRKGRYHFWKTLVKEYLYAMHNKALHRSVCSTKQSRTQAESRSAKNQRWPALPGGCWASVVHGMVENHLSYRKWNSSALFLDKSTLHLLRKVITYDSEHKIPESGVTFCPFFISSKMSGLEGVRVAMILQFVQLRCYFTWRAVTVIISFTLVFLLLASPHKQLCCFWELPGVPLSEVSR